MGLADTIRAIQEKLGADPDGKPGPETWTAIHVAVVGKKPADGAGLDAIIRAVQRKLGAFEDGSPGPETWGAIHLAVVGKKAPAEIQKADTPTLAGEGKPADSRSEGHIATLHPRVRPFARALIEKAAGQGIIIKITSAMRTYAQQDKLFAQGRTEPGADRDESERRLFKPQLWDRLRRNDIQRQRRSRKSKNACLGIAGLQSRWRAGNRAGSRMGRQLDVTPGRTHFQLRPGWAADIPEKEMLAQLRSRKDAGQDFFA